MTWRPGAPGRRDWLRQAAGAAAGLALPAAGGRAETATPVIAPVTAPAPAPAIPPFADPPPGAETSPGWQHQRLPKVERANRYRLVDEPGVGRVLRVQSAASASTWLARLGGAGPEAGLPAGPGPQTPAGADLSATPWLHWQWQVSRSLPTSDLGNKAGDDHAARLYVLFALPLQALPLGERLRIQAVRTFTGADVPAAALCYVWGRAQPAGTRGPSPYTGRVQMVVLDSGDTHAGRWRRHARDLRADWQAAFGGTMPAVAGIAVGADTDNAGGEVEAGFTALRLAARPA